jgi:transposase-like protein
MGGVMRSHREGLFRCKECRNQFTVTAGTVFHRSKVPLTKWMQILHLEAFAPRREHNTWQMAQATSLAHKTVQKMRARIYAAVGKYEGPNNIFGRRIGGYVRDQRPQSYQNPPKPRLRDEADAVIYNSLRQMYDYRNWYAWRKKHPLGTPIEAEGVLAKNDNADRGALLRTERLLKQLLATAPVRLRKKPTVKKAKVSHTRWLPKAPKTRPVATIKASLLRRSKESV